MNEYRKAVEFLLSVPEEKFSDKISEAWYLDPGNEGSPLFYFCNQVLYFRYSNGKEYGCLTEVKRGPQIAFTPELTALIRSNKLLPSRPEDIKQDREMLEEFARLQELMDETIRES